MNPMMNVPVAVPKPAPPTEEPRVIVLDATHRCVIYGCNAQAYVRAVITHDEDKYQLDYCAHHWHEREFTIGLQASTIHDETWRLTEVAKLDVSA